MATLEDLIIYICKHYPHEEELSKARLTKLIYLADWKSALEHGKQLSNIRWKYNHYGPYVDDVANLAASSEKFDIKRTINHFGNEKSLICLRSKDTSASIPTEDKEILNFVIKKTSTKYWKDFIKLVYSTYPILSRPKGAPLDLVTLASEYKKNSDTLTSSQH